MPSPDPPRPPARRAPAHPSAPTAGPGPGPSRRDLLRAALLTAGTASLLTACGVDLGSVRREQDPPTTPAPDEDELARRRAAGAAGELLLACGALRRTRPDVALLDELVAQHAVHAEALGARPPAVEGEAPPPVVPGVAPGPDLLARHGVAASQALTDALSTGPALAALLTQVGGARAVQARRLATGLGLPAPVVPGPVVPVGETAPAPGTAAPGTAAAATAAPGTAPTASPTTDGPGGPTAEDDRPVVDGLDEEAAASLTALLEGEHAAAQGLQALAVRLEGAERDAAAAAVERHRATADDLAAVLRGAGRTAPPPAPGYRLPEPVADASAARDLAGRIELGQAAGALALVPRSQGALRRAAVALHVDAVLHALRWGALAPPPPTG
ncbi:DUF4439 domain-containing protein [Thalassiella azotivora]